MLVVRFQNTLIINKFKFFLFFLFKHANCWWVKHIVQSMNSSQPTTNNNLKKKKNGEKQPNHLTKPRAHVTPSLQMTAELTKRARCCFWKDFIYNTRTAWQPITTHVWPKGVHHWWNGQIMRGNRSEALILTKEGSFVVVCCVVWGFF